MSSIDHSTVVALARKFYRQTPDVGSLKAAEFALRSHFNLDARDGIWGGSQAACSMGFKGHAESEELFSSIAAAVADDLADEPEATSARVSEDGTKLEYRVEVSGGGDLDVSPSRATFSIDKATAEVIVHLAGLVQANDLHYVKKHDHRANFLQFDPETDPEDAADAGEENSVRTECDCLCVDAEEFFFSAYVKHTDVRVATAGSSIAALANHYGLKFASKE